MPAYDYVLIETPTREEHDRYHAEGNTDELRVAIREALVDACVRAGIPVNDIDESWLWSNVVNVNAGIRVTVSGPNGLWSVEPERIA